MSWRCTHRTVAKIWPRRKRAHFEVRLGEDLSIRCVLVPAGEFLMGNQTGSGDETPLAQVRIEQPFYMGCTEVTNAQFRAVAASSHDSGHEGWRSIDWRGEGYDLDAPDQPAVRVSWHEATQFCRRLSDETGLHITLPTETQWEWACRAGVEDVPDYADWLEQRTVPSNRDTMSELEYQIRNWRVFDWIGGGRLVEAHCHELDVMDWAMQDHPVEANGMGGRQVTRGRRFGTDYDHHFHEYTYADGTKMYSQCRQMNGCWGPMTEHIHTDETVVDLMGKIRISNVRDRKEEVISPYLREHSDLLDAIWNDKPYNEGWFVPPAASLPCWAGRPATVGRSSGGTSWPKKAQPCFPPI